MSPDTPLRYREVAAAAVARVVAEVGFQCRPTLLRALRQAYPFDSKEGWPKRVWLQEVKNRTGGFKPRKNRQQLDLFDDV